jgi:hypothetical protein
VSGVYPTRLNVPAFMDWLFGLYDRRRLRLFNRNHSTVSIKESVSINKSTTVKVTQMGLLPERMRNTETGLLPDWTRNMEAPRTNVETPRTSMEASRTNADVTSA